MACIRRRGLCTGSSACMKHTGVTHLLMIILTEGVKDTVTLLLFYLLVIWERSVLPVGNAFFQAAVQRRPACGSGPQEVSPHTPPETLGAASTRRPKDGAARPGTDRSHGAFEVHKLWMVESKK